MRLRRLSIHQLPGITPGFELRDLSPGINLVTGPNAIGKSSLIRALRYLLVPPSPTDPLALSLAADFDNGALLHASRNGSALQWQQDGQIVEAPALAEPDSLHCYWLTMENLAAGDDDQVLIAQLQQALAGGFDLRALRDEVFVLQPKVGARQRDAVVVAERQRRQVEAGYEALGKQERRLPQLQQQIEQARAARSRVDQLNRALTLLDLRQRHDELERLLHDFPPQMAKLDGREAERLRELERKREAAETEQQAAAQSEASAAQQLHDTGLATAQPEAHELAATDKHVQDLAHRQEEREQLRDRQRSAADDEAHALKQLGGNQPAALTPEQISAAEQLARQLQQTEQDCAAIERRLSDAGPAPDERSIQRHSQALDTLNRWLALPKTAGFSHSLLLAISSALLLLLLALFADPAQRIVGLTPVMVGGLITALAVMLSIWLARDRQRARQQSAFAACELAPPASWSEDAVRQRRDALQQALAALYSARERAVIAKAAGDDLRHKQAELATLEQRRQTLAQQLGFDPALTAAGLDRFAKLVDDYQHAAKQRRQLEQQIDSLSQRIDSTRQTVCQFLSRWGYQTSDDSAELAAQLTDLQQRCQRASDAMQRRQQALRDQQRLAKQLASLNDEQETLYRQAGFSPDQQRELADALQRLPDWQSQQQSRRDLHGQIGLQRQALVNQPALIDQAERGERDALLAEQQVAQQQSEQYETLVHEHSELTAAVNRAGQDQQLEQATAQVDTARSQLQDRLDEQLFACAGQYLLDQIEAEYRSEHEPQVLALARERFQAFTHHAFSLELRDDAFVARDLQRNEWRALTELSSGTRMQLLLAVRLAWIQRLEKHREPLPVFLDEALTTSDEHRFQAVAQSLQMLAREEGRQFFYLSARRHELALWESATGERPHHIDMLQVRFGQTDANAEHYAVTQPPRLPAPDNLSPAQYAAALAVPAVDPRHPAESIAVFYLLRDDLPLLYTLMQDWKIHTLGQLVALLHSDAASTAIADAQQRQHLLGRCHAAIAWVEAWRQGRGKPVDRIVLEQSGAITATFIDEVSQLAQQKNGDAAQLLDALANGEVARFRNNRVEDLRDYLQQQGYLDSADSLNAEDRQRQVLYQVGDQLPPDQATQIVLWLEAASSQPDV